MNRARNIAVIDLQTPGSIKAEMDTVEAIVHQLDDDIAQSTTPQAFKDAWTTFRDEWRAFAREHASWTSRLTYAPYTKTVEYRERAQKWRDEFVRRGGAPNAPTDQRRTDWGTWLLVGGITAAALIGAGVAVAVATSSPARRHP